MDGEKQTQRYRSNSLEGLAGENRRGNALCRLGGRCGREGQADTLCEQAEAGIVADGFEAGIDQEGDEPPGVIVKGAVEGGIGEVGLMDGEVELGLIEEVGVVQVEAGAALGTGLGEIAGAGIREDAHVLEARVIAGNVTEDFGLFESVLRVADVVVGAGEVIVCGGEGGIEREDAVEFGDGIGFAAGVDVADGEVAAGDGREGVEIAGFAELGEALVEAAEVAEELAEPLVGGGVVGVESDGLKEEGFGLGEVPLVAIGFKGEGGVGLGGGGVEGEGGLDGGAGLGEGLGGGKFAPDGEEVVAVGESGVGGGVVGVAGDGLVEGVDGFEEAGFVALVEEVEAGEVGEAHLGVDGAGGGEAGWSR